MSYKMAGVARATRAAEANWYYWQPRFDKLYAELVKRDGEETAQALIEANEPYSHLERAFWNFEKLHSVFTQALGTNQS